MIVNSNNDYYNKLINKHPYPGEVNHSIAHRIELLPNLFNIEECDKVLKAFRDFPTALGTVGHASNYGDTPIPSITKQLRDCYVTYCEKTRNTTWFIERIEKALIETNDKYWKFQVSSFIDPPRLMSYYEGQHFQSYHADIGQGITSFRKLTSILFLSDPSTYEGGEFEMPGEYIDKATLSKGSLLIFPAYLVHRVSPVTKGERHTLVYRICGAPLK